MKMPVFVYYIVAGIILLVFGVTKIQRDAVAKARAEQTVKEVLAENSRVMALVDTLHRSAQRDSARAEAAEKVASAAQQESKQASKDIAAADLAAAKVDTTDWRAKFLATVPQITTRDIKIAADSITIVEQTKIIAFYLSDATKGWAAVDSLKKNNTKLVNDGIKAALAINGCSIGPVPCPPRWLVALGTAAGTLYLTKKK